MNERDLFIEALQRPEPAERAAYLDQACAGVAALRRRVEILLKADTEAREVLKQPPPPGTAITERDLSSTSTATEIDDPIDLPGTWPFVDAPGQDPLSATELDTGIDPPGTLPIVTEPGDASSGATEQATGDDQQTASASADQPAEARAGARKVRGADPRVDPELTIDLPAGHQFRPPRVSGLAQFDLLSVLGRGGMGVVYKARHRPLNRIVALKMILDGKNAHSEYHERFRIEAEAVACLHHPNIIQIYDLGEADGCPYFMLELLEGGSLADRLKGTTQPARTAAELVETLARAMHAAHLAGIVHRDLKPSNVLFDRDGSPKITDFGLAKRLEADAGQTQTGQIMGTPSYMAPEQAQGDVHKMGPRADVYALGAILYESLTGRPPFKGPTAVSTLRQVVYDDVVPPSRIEPRIARDLETICLKCLQKDPERRYGTAAELAVDLRRYLDNRPVRARRTPLWEQGAKWTRRHPTTATLLGLAAAAALVLAVVGLHYDAERRDIALADSRKLQERLATSEQVLDLAQARLLGNDWDEGRYILGKLVTDLKDDRRLDRLRDRAQRMLDQSEQKVMDAAEERRAHEHQRDFIARRDEAFFHETRFTRLDRAWDVSATRAAAHSALTVFAESGPGDAWTFIPLPRALTPREQAQIRNDCYALLLVLAEAVAEAIPGEEPGFQADRGLRLLDRAAALRAEPTPAWHRQRAACLVRKGDARGALRERAAADRLTPTTILDHFLAGRDAGRRQDWKTALAELEAVLRIEPDHFWANCLSAIAAIQIQQPGMAKLGLSACIAQQPERTELRLLRGIAAHQAAVLARTAGKSPSIEDPSVDTAAALQFEAAETDYRTALALLAERRNDELRYTVMVDRAVMRFQRGRLDEAATDLEEAIRIDGQQYHAFEKLALVHQRQRQWDEAVERFTQAIRLNPTYAPLYRARAAVALERDDQSAAHQAAALRDLEDAIRHEQTGNPVQASDQIERGKLLRRARRFEEALAACDAALKVAPELDTAHGLRVQVLLDLDRPDEAIRSRDGALARGKPWTGLYELRGVARASRGNYARAIEDYSHALVLNPGQPRVLSSRGLAYLFSDAPKLALGDFDDALRLDPSSSEAHSGRGRALVLLGDHRGATAAAEDSLHHDAPTARRALNAARIYAKAALAAAAEVEARGRLAVGLGLVDRYQGRAIDLIKLAIDRTPAERRAAYWQDNVAADPDLRPLHRRLRPLQPAGTAGGTAPSSSAAGWTPPDRTRTANPGQNPASVTIK